MTNSDLGLTKMGLQPAQHKFEKHNLGKKEYDWQCVLPQFTISLMRFTSLKQKSLYQTFTPSFQEPD